MAQDSPPHIIRSPSGASTSTSTSLSTTQQMSIDPLSSDPVGPADDDLPEVGVARCVPLMPANYSE